LPLYFSQISKLLKEDGAAMIQAITMPDYRYQGYLKRVDYIRSRVFPGSCVPSVSALIEAAVKNSDLRPARLSDFGYQYKRTLQEWRKRFIQNKKAVQSLGHNDRFIRDWEYYLCYCEAGFAEGYTSDVHLLLTKPDCRIARGFTPPNNAR
ncbi:MAG: SAM-dependent methyltransferase, partial [Opitutae bacterium]|nr:SAM-dependent methyltransferase [Opitutae bacterium]